MKILFSILHYKNAEITKRCADSLLALNCPEDAEPKVLIVDNNSANGSLEELQSCYKDESRISFIASPDNLGFAKGNNLAFDYAKEQAFDALILLNNDTEIVQPDFIGQLIEQAPFDVLSPDVFDPYAQQHQSPLYKGSELRQCAADEIKEKSRYIDASFTKQAVVNAKAAVATLLSPIPAFQRAVAKRVQGYTQSVDWEEAQEDVVPQGSAVIYGKSYIDTMPYAFYPETKMYFEEAILKVLCDKHDLRVRYTPKLQVLHHHFEPKAYIKRSFYKRLNSIATLEKESYGVLCSVAGWTENVE